MTMEGKIYRQGKFWLAEVPALDGMTQGFSRKEAVRMLKDLVRSLVERPDLKVQIREAGGKRVLIETNEHALVMGAVFRQQRQKRGLTIRQVANALGSRSPNAYAAYESGKREPSLSKVDELLAALDPEGTIRLRVG